MKNKLPEGWEEVTLSEVCEVKKGTSITKDKVTEGNIPVIAGGQQPAYYHNVPNRTGETITVSGSGAYAGFVAYFNIPIFASDCSTIQAKTKDVSIRYIYYLLKGQQKLIYDLQKGIAQPHVYPKDLAKIKIPLPPFPTQQKIVSILEKAEQAKEWRNKSDELTKEFLKSIFVEMFGDSEKNNKQWPIIEIDDCVEQAQYGTSTKSNNERKGVMIMGMNSISQNGEINLLKHSYVEIPKNEFEKLRLQKGDVIFNRTNSPDLVGKTAYWDSDLDAVLASYLVKLKMKQNCNPIFFTYLMNTNYFKEIFHSSCKKAVNQANISPTLLKTFKMYLPPLPLQQKFASIVQEVEAMKEQQKHSEEHLNNLFNALMQKAFRGELVV